MCVPPAFLLLLALLIIPGPALTLSSLSISASQLHVSGTPNSSLLLPTSYRSPPRTNWLQLKWEHLASTNELIKCTIRTIRSADDTKEHVDINTYPVGGREGRMEIVPENGSLIIHRLNISDAGSYQVTIRDSSASASAVISVIVQDIEPADEEAAAEAKISTNCFCLSISGNIDLPASISILIGSHLLSTFITVFILFCQLKIKKKRSP
ncbi:hypothetical protein XENTR_v10000225 [Xenopus tropicalis]|uniref:Uncharacterized protein LOC101734828 n=1 Tax=Xenopus tropicalis TaxID=8364 RepID=A0A8J0R0K9_XENTR|nr:uncharacterized protein LOC101734828 [Xenopus tropicalis]KAE8628793.1 hypothetical protein XENTR_v10000225 [Xenopus tropicalis]|eukprot:XP_004911344.1 PREDICTED: uncharacterized protein LOC101734828 [Xenopus tropicalis]